MMPQSLSPDDPSLSAEMRKALSLFRCPPRHLLCAQTVCAAMGREDLVDSMKEHSGGRAPGGTCGALYAAIAMAPQREAEMRAFFRSSLGSDLCKELKQLHHVPCPHCVVTAIRALTAM